MLSGPGPFPENLGWRAAGYGIFSSYGWSILREDVKSNTALRRSPEARGHFSQNIPFLRDAGQLATQRVHLFITGSSVAHKGLLGCLAQVALPPSQDIRPDSQIWGHLAHRHPRCIERRRFTFVLGCKLLSLS